MSWFKKQYKNVALPVTPEEFDKWSQNIITTFNLPDTDDTRDAIATSIMHLNQNIAAYPLEYFADAINKSRANAAAYTRLQEFAAKRKQAQEDAAKTVVQPVEAAPGEEAKP